MVDPWVLTNDVIGGIGSLVLTPLLWVALFLWAWLRPAEARASGFGRMTFWLLLPGAFLSSVADAPFLGWAGDVLAINVGGALIPIVLSIVLLHRELGGTRWGLTAFVFLVLAIECSAQFAAVVLTSGFWSLILVPAIAGAVVLGAVLFWPKAIPAASSARAQAFLALVSVALIITYFTSASVPGEGILSSFPYYLLGPWVVGLIATWMAATVWRVPAYRGLGIGYGTATLGTLLGADLLREPPLYVGSGGELLAIGGAGILDLVYFSGLMALGAGLLLIAVRYRGTAVAGAGTVPTSAEDRLRAAVTSLDQGDFAGSVRESVAASQSAATRVRSIFQIPPPAQPSEAWDGLPVAPYVVHDYQNLVSSESHPSPSRAEARRSLAMASQFVRLGRDLSRLRFAAPGRRAWAVAVDLSLVTLPAVVLWVALAVRLPGSADVVLSGLPFNLAVFAYVGYAALYFVVCDTLFGATAGKALFHLGVTDRNLARPGWLQSFLREAPKALVIYVIGDFGGPAVLFLVRSSSAPLSTLGIDLAVTSAVLLGIVIIFLVGALAVGGAQLLRDSERQRLGDRWASTWVLDRRQITPAWGAMQPPTPVPSGPAPPG